MTDHARGAVGQQRVSVRVPLELRRRLEIHLVAGKVEQVLPHEAQPGLTAGLRRDPRDHVDRAHGDDPPARGFVQGPRGLDFVHLGDDRRVRSV